ncbi:hypothetical protein ACHAXR_010224 [Thalassiosira sp. AJA248-18]
MSDDADDCCVSKIHNSNNGSNKDSAMKNNGSTSEQSDGSSSDDANDAGNECKQNNGKMKPHVQTITITADDIASAFVSSIVDPWVPRIRNDDEYLHRGLDFSPKSINSSSGSMLSNEKEDVDEEEQSPADGSSNNVDSEDGNSCNNVQSKTESNDNNQKLNQDIDLLVGDIGATRLSEALVHNTRLLYLNLSRSNIGIDGGVALAKCLYSRITTSTTKSSSSSPLFKSKTVIRVLNLSHNQISNEGAMEFAQTLRYNKSLKELKLSNNGISLAGILALLEGLELNKKLIRLGLNDNIKNLTCSGEEVAGVVQSVGRVLRKGCKDRTALEVLEMHHTNNGMTRDNFDGLSNDDVLCLRCAMYGIDAPCHRKIGNKILLLKNHRFRKLTLPPTGGGDHNGDGRGNNPMNKNDPSIQQLRQIFQFNNFYRPILQLHDILKSPLAQAEASLSVSIKLPHHLQRDANSGALIGLLPPSFNINKQPPSSVLPQSPQTLLPSSVGMEYKLMPKVLSFVFSQCSLDTCWNVIRYRPDIFCCSRPGVVVECAPCAFMRGGGDGCCIS